MKTVLSLLLGVAVVTLTCARVEGQSNARYNLNSSSPAAGYSLATPAYRNAPAQSFTRYAVGSSSPATGYVFGVPYDSAVAQGNPRYSVTITGRQGYTFGTPFFYGGRGNPGLYYGSGLGTAPWYQGINAPRYARWGYGWPGYTASNYPSFGPYSYGLIPPESPALFTANYLPTGGLVSSYPLSMVRSTGEAFLGPQPPIPAEEMTVPKSDIAYIEVIVPAGAELIFDGTKTAQSGRTRAFYTPMLEAGRSYSYEVQARWTENGRETIVNRRVTVQAGSRQTLDFTNSTPRTDEIPSPAPNKQ